MQTELRDKTDSPAAAPTSAAASQNFIEASLKLGGKSEEEASRTGRLDQADEQVEALFAPRYQTSQSPIHRAVWTHEVPVDLFRSQVAPVSAECQRVMDESLEVV